MWLLHEITILQVKTNKYYTSYCCYTTHNIYFFIPQLRGIGTHHKTKKQLIIEVISIKSSQFNICYCIRSHIRQIYVFTLNFMYQTALCIPQSATQPGMWRSPDHLAEGIGECTRCHQAQGEEEPGESYNCAPGRYDEYISPRVWLDNQAQGCQLQTKGPARVSLISRAIKIQDHL